MEKQNFNEENRYIVGSDGYLPISWEPNEDTKRALPCLNWEADNPSVDDIVYEVARYRV